MADNNPGNFDNLVVKTSPVGTDYIIISDTENDDIPKKSLISSLPGGGGGGNGGGFTWNDITTGSATAAAGNAYFADAGTLTTFTLPTTPTLGDSYRFVNSNTGGFTIVYGTGQSIQFGDETSTTTSGSLSSAAKGDEVTVTFFKSNVFYAYASQGNLTVA